MKYIKIIGLVILFYILMKLNYRSIFAILKDVNIFYLLLFVISWYIYLVAKVYRWHTVENYFCKPLNFKQNGWIFIETFYLGFVTPARTGDIMKVWILHKEFNIPKSRGFLAYFFDRIQDLIFLSIFALYGIVFVFKIKISYFFYLFILALFFIYIFKNTLLRLVGKKFELLKDLKVDRSFEGKLFVINTIAFFFYFLQFHLLSKSLHLNINYNFIVALLSISAIASLLPVSISGLGIREGIFIYLFKSINISKEYAVTLSLLDNIFFMALFAILLYLFNTLYLRKRIFA